MSDDPTGNGEEVGEDEVVDLSAMTEAQLRARHAELTTAIDELLEQEPTLATAAQITELKAERNLTVDAVNGLLAFQASSEDEPTIADPAAEATEDAEPEAAPAEDATPEVEAEAATEDTTTTEKEPQVSDTTPTPEPADSGASDEVLAAAAEVVDASGAELAMTASARPTAPTQAAKPRVAYVAGAGQRQFAQGMEMDWEGLARAWDSRKSLRPGPDGGVESAVIANLPAYEDTQGLGVEMLTRGNSTVENDRLIQASVDAWRMQREGAQMPAHVAAICEPLDIIREIPECGETNTPFTDLFPQRPIGRLGFTFTRASAAADTDDAINLWAQADQDLIDEDDASTWKPCIPIECATPSTVTAEELVTCVSVDTSTEMSSPERVREFMQKLRVQRARRREQIQLARFDATASGFNFTAHNGYGTIPSLVEAIETMMPQLAYPERLDETDWDIVVEPGLIQKLTIDRHNVGNPVEVAAARAETMTWLRSYLGRNVVELRDFKGASAFQSIPAANTEDDLDALPATDRIRFVPASAYIYGSTGEEATGWQTDPQLVRQNKKQAFTMEWFLLAKHGCHPAAYIDLTSTPDGGRAGLVPGYGYSEYVAS